MQEKPEQKIQEPELIIRKMRKADLEKVLLLENACFSSPWSEKSFLDAMASENAIYLSAEVNGEVVGYCGFFLAADSADLCNMLVAEEMRHRGIGERLLQEGFSFLKQKNIENVFLEVRESNAPAIGLYQKMGFEKNGFRRGYYDAPKEDAVLMCSNLFH